MYSWYEYFKPLCKRTTQQVSSLDYAYLPYNVNWEAPESLVGEGCFSCAYKYTQLFYSIFRYFSTLFDNILTIIKALWICLSIGLLAYYFFIIFIISSIFSCSSFGIFLNMDFNLSSIKSSLKPSISFGDISSFFAIS